MAKTVCKLLGIVFVIVGVAGFVAPHLLGAHLVPVHNLIHLVSGAIALYFGFAGNGFAQLGEKAILCFFKSFIKTFFFFGREEIEKSHKNNIFYFKAYS